MKLKLYLQVLRALHYPVVPKFSPVALPSQIAGIFFSLLMATELAPRGKIVPKSLCSVTAKRLVLVRNKISGILPSVRKSAFRLFLSVMAMMGKLVERVNTGKRLRK